jgi:hypothetical protein
VRVIFGASLLDDPASNCGHQETQDDDKLRMTTQIHSIQFRIPEGSESFSGSFHCYEVKSNRHKQDVAN